MKHKQLLALMGKTVTVHQIMKLNRGEEYEDHQWEREEAYPRAGWVVGIRYLQNGKQAESGDYMEGYRRYLDIGEVTPALQVCYWPTMKPVFVPLDGYTIGGEPYLKKEVWEDKWRRLQADTMKDVPRDSRGRWMKG